MISYLMNFVLENISPMQYNHNVHFCTRKHITQYKHNVHNVVYTHMGSVVYSDHITSKLLSLLQFWLLLNILCIIC